MCRRWSSCRSANPAARAGSGGFATPRVLVFVLCVNWRHLPWTSVRYRSLTRAIVPARRCCGALAWDFPHVLPVRPTQVSSVGEAMCSRCYHTHRLRDRSLPHPRPTRTHPDCSQLSAKPRCSHDWYVFQLDMGTSQEVVRRNRPKTASPLVERQPSCARSADTADHSTPCVQRIFLGRLRRLNQPMARSRLAAEDTPR